MHTHSLKRPPLAAMQENRPRRALARGARGVDSRDSGARERPSPLSVPLLRRPICNRHPPPRAFSASAGLGCLQHLAAGPRDHREYRHRQQRRGAESHPQAHGRSVRRQGEESPTPSRPFSPIPPSPSLPQRLPSSRTPKCCCGPPTITQLLRSPARITAAGMNRPPSVQLTAARVYRIRSDEDRAW